MEMAEENKEKIRFEHLSFNHDGERFYTEVFNISKERLDFFIEEIKKITKKCHDDDLTKRSEILQKYVEYSNHLNDQEALMFILLSNEYQDYSAQKNKLIRDLVGLLDE